MWKNGAQFRVIQKAQRLFILHADFENFNYVLCKIKSPVGTMQQNVVHGDLVYAYFA